MAWMSSSTMSEYPELQALDDLSDVMEWLFESGWSDGLPVIPPTPRNVQRMLAGTTRQAEALIGHIPPKGGRATVEKIAINAVMAGCKPDYLPVVIAAVEALLDDRCNTRGVQCSTHIASPLVIVNGPLVPELGINCGHNVFGPGWRANATIGRAVKLVLVNLGGASPGIADKATFGHPGKFTYCIAENEAANPWEPLHVERGFAPTDSTVTVFAAEAPHNINNHWSATPHGLLQTVADTMATLGSNHLYLGGESFLVLGPEHADVLARAGWTKRDVRAFLFEHARKPLVQVKIGGMYGPETRRNLWPRWIDHDDDQTCVPIARRADDIAILVAGGAGRHSVYLPGWGSRSATRKIQP
jgi:hypothetical protein